MTHNQLAMDIPYFNSNEKRKLSSKVDLEWAVPYITYLVIMCCVPNTVLGTLGFLTEMRGDSGDSILNPLQD